MKSNVSYVALNRAEGPVDECMAVVFYTGDMAPVLDGYFESAMMTYKVSKKDIFAEVQRKLRAWGETAPDNGGYDKTDFAVAWENGESYTGRFDMQRGGYDSGETFWGSLKSRLEFYALRRRPSHFSDKDWAYFSKVHTEDGGNVVCEKILNECELVA